MRTGQVFGRMTNKPNRMKQNLIKSLVIIAACGLATAVRADAVPASGSLGLLGQTYAGVTYSYTDMDGSSVDGADYIFEYNQPLSTGFDAVFTYDYGRSEEFSGTRFKSHAATAALRAFSTTTTWAKPYVEAGLGYGWTKVAGFKDNSYLWEVAVGAEFQVAPAFTLTPFVQYSDAPNLAASEGTWDYGVKANYWVNNQFALSAGISRDDDKNTSYSVGLNVRF